MDELTTLSIEIRVDLTGNQVTPEGMQFIDGWEKLNSEQRFYVYQMIKEDCAFLMDKEVEFMKEEEVLN